jgi:hypothetical protein
MVDRNHILTVLRSTYGDFNTQLEHQYSDRIIAEISENKVNSVRQWLTYHQVILELKSNLDTLNKSKELQYRISDGENPKSACMKIISEINDCNSELKRLYEKINNF